MPDHGGDLVSVVANTTIDAIKDLVKISGMGLIFLWNLQRNGQKIKSGELNIKKLIKGLDEGDRIADAGVSKNDAEKIAQYAKKHKVVYAIVEDAKGNYIVYFKASQADRMKNVLKDLQIDHLKKEEKTEQEKADQEKQLVIKEKEEPAEKFDPEIKSDETEVVFDPRQPKEYLEVVQYYDPEKSGTAIYLHQEGKGAQQIAAEKGSEIYSQYENVLSFKAKGFYQADKLDQQIDNMMRDYMNREKQKQGQEERAYQIDKAFQEKAELEGSLHLFRDQKNSKNCIAIYKTLEDNGSGKYETVNKMAVFLDGTPHLGVTEQDARDILSGYSDYRYTEKSGKGAKRQYENLVSGKAFEEKAAAKEKQEDLVTEEPQRKSLDEYEMEIKKMKESEKLKQEPQKQAKTQEVPLAKTSSEKGAR